MLEDWGLDDSRSWRPGYLRPGERAGEIQASARGKGRRSGWRSAGKGGKGERVREIEGGSEGRASARAIGARGRRRMGSGCRALDAGRFFPTGFS